MKIIKTIFFVLVIILSTKVLSAENQTTEKINNSEKCETYQAKKKSRDGESQKTKPLEICIIDVFDTSKAGEDGAFYRLVNFLHINTKAKYIKQKLLFEAGDDPSEESMRESERALRAENYLREASVSKTDDKVLVKTGDAWTTEPIFNYGRKGGVTKTSIGLKEENFLGHGFRLSVKKTHTPERDSKEFKFTDSTFLSSDKSANFLYANTSDGVLRDFSLEKPFLSLDSHFSYGIHYFQQDKYNDFYHQGDSLYNYGSAFEQQEFYYGLSNGLINKRVFRHQFGVGSRLDVVSDITINQSNLDKYNIANTQVIEPHDNKDNYVFYQFSSIGNGFKKVTDFQSIGRIEDVNIALEFSIKLLFMEDSVEKNGSLESVINFSKKVPVSEDDFVSWSGSLNLSKRSQYKSASTKLYYFNSQTERFKLYTALQLNWLDEGNKQNQLILDDLNGLRGYPANFTDGNKSGIVTLEERYYAQHSLYHILNYGAALFYDHAYIKDDKVNEPGSYYRSIGIGLRFLTNRVSDAGVIHVDISKPLDLDTNKNSFEISVGLKQTF